MRILEAPMVEALEIRMPRGPVGPALVPVNLGDVLILAATRQAIGKPWEPGFLEIGLAEFKRAAEIAERRVPRRFRRPKRTSLGVGWAFLKSAKATDILLPITIPIRKWFEEDPKRLRVVGGWAARVGAVVVSGVLTYYTGGATTPLLVSSLNVLMTDPATTTWEDDLTGFVMASQVIPPADQPPDLLKHAEVTEQVNANLWELPPERREEILAKGEAHLLKIAEGDGPEAVEEMQRAIAAYRARGNAGAFAKENVRALVAEPEPGFVDKYRTEIGLAIAGAGLVLGGTGLWYILAE